MTPRRVVVTGLGPVSPIGLGAEAFRAGLRAGAGGVHPLRLFDPSGLPVRFGGEIEEFDARDYLDKKDRKQLKFMVRTIQLAVAAARLARADAGLTEVDPERFGVVMGTGIIPGDLADLGAAGRACLTDAGIDLAKWGREGLPLIPPMWMLNHVPNMPASHVAILHDARGPCNTVVQSDAAALLALIEARRAVERGAADAMLAGGTDTRTGTISVIRALLYATLSRRNDDPPAACRPFARDREGHVLGEGAGVLLLEDRDHALRRGARVYAEVAGTGMATGEGGLTRAIRAALKDAGVGPEDIDHVNASAGGGAEDVSEGQAIREALGDVPVLAMKSYLGNAGNGASGLELMASILALREGVVPASLNAETPDPACGVRLIREPRRVRTPWALKLARTDRGQCAAVVVWRGE